MSSVFIPVLVFVAHDAACKKGDELLFHSMADCKKGPKDEPDAAEDEVGCVVLCIMLLVGAAFGIYWLITH